MGHLVACPFCREMFEPKEAKVCPSCGLALKRVSELPPAKGGDDEAEDALSPDEETLPWTYAGRGRGPLVVLSVLGIVAFFLPWVHETMPERQTLSGLGLARHLGWIWAPLIAWFVMLPLVLSRRSVYRMRGARVAVCFLAGIALVTVAIRVLFPPPVTKLDPHLLTWGTGLWATGALAVAALVVGVRFGGRIDHLSTTKRRRPDDATLH